MEDMDEADEDYNGGGEREERTIRQNLPQCPEVRRLCHLSFYLFIIFVFGLIDSRPVILDDASSPDDLL